MIQYGKYPNKLEVGCSSRFKRDDYLLHVILNIMFKWNCFGGTSEIAIRASRALRTWELPENESLIPTLLIYACQRLHFQMPMRARGAHDAAMVGRGVNCCDGFPPPVPSHANAKRMYRVVSPYEYE